MTIHRLTDTTPQWQERFRFGVRYMSALNAGHYFGVSLEN